MQFKLLFTALCLAASTSVADETEKQLVISSGNVTGVYYPTAGAICREINLDKTDNLTCLVRTSSGSFQALEELEENGSNLALLQYDIADDAYSRQGLFNQKKELSDLRTIATLYDDIFTIVTRKDAPISNFDEIKNKKVSYGTAGSGTYAMLNALMKTKKLKINDFVSVVSMPPSEQAEALCNGEIDVVIYAVAHPNGIINEIFKSCDAKLISISPNEINAVASINKHYRPAIISKSHYGNPEEITSFSSKAALVATTKLSNSSAYNLARKINKSIPALRNSHPALKTLESQDLVKNEGNIPIHPGAKKYYAEAGLLNPAD